MTIGWIEVHLTKYGAIVYNEDARRLLARKHSVELIDATAKTFRRFRYLRIPESVMRLVRLAGVRDIWIRDFYSVLPLSFDKTQGKQVAIMHHLDFSGFPLFSRPLLFFLKKIFYRNLRKIDAIVVVSRYWEKHFQERGYENVRLIYNGFDLSQFEIQDEEVAIFKKQYHLESKPIVYLGNCQKPKGVVEAYETLKGLDVHLVTSGTPRVRLPAKNFEVEYREYLVLLKASTVVITMSKFLEGWNRTAHEAILLGTPVIGSGKGGMRELLEGGGQIVCEDFFQLRGYVEEILTDRAARDEMERDEYVFAKAFTLQKFEKEWNNFLEEIVSL